MAEQAESPNHTEDMKDWRWGAMEEEEKGTEGAGDK